MCVARVDGRRKGRNHVKVAIVRYAIIRVYYSAQASL